jgi:hypothetical protein
LAVERGVSKRREGMENDNLYYQRGSIVSVSQRIYILPFWSEEMKSKKMGKNEGKIVIPNVNLNIIVVIYSQISSPCESASLPILGCVYSHF